MLVANSAPVAKTKSIKVFEGIKYSNSLIGSDAEAASLRYSLVSNGRLGVAEVIDNSDGEFTYKPNPLAKGADFFSFKVNDGDKDSSAANVNVDIIPNSVSCQGPGNLPQDSDGDGYADYVELAFGTAVDNAASTPAGLNAADFGVNFGADHDSDGYSDINELWLMHDHLTANDMPSDSTLKGVPVCLSALYDAQPPALQGFTILTPTVDLGAGDTVARFALTALDNAAGIKRIG